MNECVQKCCTFDISIALTDSVSCDMSFKMKFGRLFSFQIKSKWQTNFFPNKIHRDYQTGNIFFISNGIIVNFECEKICPN